MQTVILRASILFLALVCSTASLSVVHAQDQKESGSLPLLAALPEGLAEESLEQLVDRALVNGPTKADDLSFETDSLFELPQYKGSSIDDFLARIPEEGTVETEIPNSDRKAARIRPTKRPVTKESKVANHSWANWSEAELLSSETLARLAIEKRRKERLEAARQQEPPTRVNERAQLHPRPVPLTALAVTTKVAPVPQVQKPVPLKRIKAPVIGAPIFIRIFKEEAELELWMKTGQQFSLFKTYPICRFSGRLGPKLKTGDHQAPEGFYFVGRNQMNPYSRNHRAFNLGFPNLYDRSFGRTGSFLMVHGGCSSVGCYAITDEHISEVYALADAALAEGQSAFQVQAFPFRMTEANMRKHRNSRWYGFWQNLKVGYDAFELKKVPALVSVAGRNYVFGPSILQSQSRLARIGKVPTQRKQVAKKQKKKLRVSKKTARGNKASARLLVLQDIDPYRVTAVRLERKANQ